MSERMWYEEYQKELHEEQDSMTREQLNEEMMQNAEHVFDPATAPKQGHRWIDRGLKLSCEGAGHAYHQAWKSMPMH